MEVAIKERPIIFGPESIRAIQAGSKTETRRVIKEQPQGQNAPGKWADMEWWTWKTDVLQTTRALTDNLVAACPYGQPGDRLWVRETWADLSARSLSGQSAAYKEFPADRIENERWRSPVTMPRQASRFLLEIGEVHAEVQQEPDDEIPEAGLWVWVLRFKEVEEELNEKLAMIDVG